MYVASINIIIDSKNTNRTYVISFNEVVRIEAV